MYEDDTIRQFGVANILKNKKDKNDNWDNDDIPDIKHRPLTGKYDHNFDALGSDFQRAHNYNFKNSSVGKHRKNYNLSDSNIIRDSIWASGDNNKWGANENNSNNNNNNNNDYDNIKNNVFNNDGDNFQKLWSCNSENDNNVNNNDNDDDDDDDNNNNNHHNNNINNNNNNIRDSNNSLDHHDNNIKINTIEEVNLLDNKCK